MNFWDFHGPLFIFFMFFFPRLTMLFGAAVTSTFGVIGWLGWVFMPRFTVAIIATNLYWETNSVLVVLAWIWALTGESAEKAKITMKSRR